MRYKLTYSVGSDRNFSELIAANTGAPWGIMHENLHDTAQFLPKWT